jgi:ferredoxin
VFSAVEKQVILCDHCGGKPACVNVCPTGALLYGECGTQDGGQRLRAMGEIRKTLIRKERRR